MQILCFLKFMLSNTFYQYFVMLSVLLYFFYKYLVKEKAIELYAYDKSYFNSLIKHPFLDQPRLSYISFSLFCFYLAGYCFLNVIYSGFANHFDQLIQFYFIFKGDIWAPNIWIGEGRFFPLGNFYFNILIPIFDKAYMLHAIVFCQTLILVFILYKLFDIVKVWQRLFLIAFILFIPNIFHMQYSLIYPDRDIIFLFASFVFFSKRFFETSQSKYLWCLFFVANVSLYFKEVAFSLFVGFSFIRLLYFYINKEFSLKDFFIKPLTIVKRYPLEFGLTFCSFMYIFSYLYFIRPWLYSAGYVDTHKKDFLSLLEIAFTDLIFISFIVFFIFRAIYLIKHRNRFNLFWDSLAFGNLLYYLSYIFLGLLNSDLSYYSPADFISVLYIFYFLVYLDKIKLKAFFVALILLIVFVFVNTNVNWLLLNKQKGISWEKTALFLEDYVNKNGSINLHTFFLSWYSSVGIARYLSCYKLNVLKYNSDELGDNHIKLYNKDTTDYPDGKCWNWDDHLCFKTEKIYTGDLVLVSPEGIPGSKALYNEYNNNPDYKKLFDSFNVLPPLLKFNDPLYRNYIFVKIS
jgi:hypothetical protein